MLSFALLRRTAGLSLVFIWLACDKSSTGPSASIGTWDIVPGQVFPVGTARDSLVGGSLVVTSSQYDGYILHYHLQGSTVPSRDSTHVSGPNSADVGTGCGQNYPAGTLHLFVLNGDTATAIVSSYSGWDIRVVKRGS